MKKFKYIITVLSLWTLTSSLYSQQTKTDSADVWFYFPKVVVSANRYEKQAFESHLSVQSVPKQRVWQRAVDNPGELLQEAGVQFSDAGPWSQKLVVRGLSGSQVLTLVDGLRVDVLRAYGNHAPLLDVSELDRVEVIRGPGSILYGSNAIGGVINFITHPLDNWSNALQMNGRVVVQYASVNQQMNETALLRGSTNRWRFLLSIGHRKADDITTPKGTLANSAFQGITVDSKISARLGGQQSLELAARLNRMSDVGVPTSPYATLAQFKTYNNDFISLTHRYQNKNASYLKNTELTYYYQIGKRNFEARMEAVPKGPLFVFQELAANRDVKTTGMTSQAQLVVGANQLLTSGIDYFQEWDDTRRIADAEIRNAAGTVMKNPPADLTPPTPKSDRLGVGVFVEHESRLLSRLTLTTALRYDQLQSRANGTTGTLTLTDVSKNDGDFSGGVGVLFNLTNALHLTGNIGRAFKAPTLQERFFKGTAQPGYVYGNPDLNSETSLNFDAGLKWQFKQVAGEMSVFQNRIEDYIVLFPKSAAGDTLAYENVGKARLRGGELFVDWRLSRYVSIWGNTTFVRARDLNQHEDLPKIPALQGMLGLRFQNVMNLYWFELMAQFVGDQNRVAENELKTPGYSLLHASAGCDAGKLLGMKQSLILTINIKNLLDRSFRDHLSTVIWWDAPGRNIVVGLHKPFTF